MIDFLLPAGWTIVLAAVALWWGERQRRIDAQRREERLPVIPPPPPRPARVRVDQTATPAYADISDGRQHYIDEMVREGFDPEEAAADWDAMIESQHSDVRIQ